MVPGRPRRRSLIQLGSAAAASSLASILPEGLAGAAPLSAAELARLAAGELIKVPLDLDLPEGSYFGGLSYGVIHAPVAEVAAVLADPSTYTSILPMTLEARLLSRHGRDMQVFLRQGDRAGNAAYVLLVRRESQGLFRYWLDPSQPHEIADQWGSFRVQGWGSGACLLTYAALLRLDFGLVRLLFSETIRRFALTTPRLVRAFVQGRQAK